MPSAHGAMWRGAQHLPALSAAAIELCAESPWRSTVLPGVCRGTLGFEVSSMKEHKVRVIVLADGRVVVEGVPVTRGQEVEVNDPDR